MSDPEEVLQRLAAAESVGDQVDVLRSAWGSAGLVELSVQEADEILRKMAAATTRAEQLNVMQRCTDEYRLKCAFDVAVSPLMMSQPQLRLLFKIAQVGSAQTVDLKRIARALDELETGSFMSAAQAMQLMQAACVPDRDKFRWWHVVCARVLDKWNLTEEDHSQVACYYGWDSAYLTRILRQVRFITDSGKPEVAATLSTAELQGRVLGEQSAAEQGSPPILSRELQNRVLAHMGKADHVEYAHSQRVPIYAATLIGRNLCSGASNACAICLDPCQNGCALWRCKRCSNELHASCYRDWAKKRKASDGDEVVPCPYCRHHGV